MAEQPQELSRYQVTAAAAGQRLDVFLAAVIGGVSRAKVQKLAALQAVAVNGKPARAKQLLASGDEVTVRWAPPPRSTLTPVAMPLAILYEDAHILVLNKPAGISVHPGAGDHGPTLVQGLLHHCGQLGSPPLRPGEAPPWQRPGIVHRLDKDTTGVLICAKTDRAHANLAAQFHDKTTLERSYTALLDGCMTQAEIVYSSYLHRDPLQRLRFASLTLDGYGALAAKGGGQRGYRFAKSHFRRQVVYGQRLTLANIRLFTGRTHQIRVHAAALRLAIVGDGLYHHSTQLPLHFPAEVRAAVAAVSRQMLHAQRLLFRHPESGEKLAIEAPLPVDFSDLINLLSGFAASP